MIVNLVLQQMSADTVTNSVAHSFVLKEVHVVRDANEHHLTGVDLKQDENLVAHEEQAALPRVLKPLVTVVAEQEVVIVGTCGIVVSIHGIKANSNADHWEGAEKDVRVEENPCLLFKQLLVVPDPVDVALWHVFQVDKIVVPVETQIKDLLSQDKGTKQAESERVKFLIARAGRSDTEKQSQCKNMEEYAHDTVVDVGGWMFVVISCGRAPIRYNAEG